MRTCYCIEVSKFEVKVDGEDNLCGYNNNIIMPTSAYIYAI